MSHTFTSIDEWYTTGRFPFNFTSEIQYYVRPQVHNKLTDFCKTLTAITQENVDSGRELRDTLLLYDQWLKDNGLSIDNSAYPSIETNNRSSCSKNNADISSSESPSFCIITWGDSDLGTILKDQCKRLDIELPIYFHQWINLKSLFKKHFGWEPHGGLQNVVERLGFVFEGRAHSGLVDSINTAKIVKKMLEEGFKFNKATRNIHAYRNKPKWRKNMFISGLLVFRLFELILS